MVFICKNYTRSKNIASFIVTHSQFHTQISGGQLYIAFLAWDTLTVNLTSLSFDATSSSSSISSSLPFSYSSSCLSMFSCGNSDGSKMPDAGPSVSTSIGERPDFSGRPNTERAVQTNAVLTRSKSKSAA